MDAYIEWTEQLNGESSLGACIPRAGPSPTCASFVTVRRMLRVWEKGGGGWKGRDRVGAIL
jgi:hypothetical protein